MEYIYNLNDISKIVLDILKQTNKKIFFLNGNLGVGKTTLIKEFVKQLGVKKSVISPTYSIVNQYVCKKKIFHIDLYRLQSFDQILDIGIEEYLYSGNYCFVEWSQLLEELQIDDLKVLINIEYKGRNRKLIVIL